MTSAKASRDRHSRDGGRFLALPHVVMKSAAFTSLTGHQVKLDIAMQLGNANNGRLSASWRYLSEERGWTSKDTIRRSLAALEERGLIFCTRKGRLPNVAAWYAVTITIVIWTLARNLYRVGRPAHGVSGV